MDFFEAEAIKAVAVLIIYCSCVAAEPTGTSLVPFFLLICPTVTGEHLRLSDSYSLH